MQVDDAPVVTPMAPPMAVPVSPIGAVPLQNVQGRAPPIAAAMPINSQQIGGQMGGGRMCSKRLPAMHCPILSKKCLTWGLPAGLAKNLIESVTKDLIKI